MRMFPKGSWKNLQRVQCSQSEVEPVGNKGGHTIHMKGYKARQSEKRPWRRRTHHPYEGVQGETRGDKTLAKADTPEIQGETKGDKTLEKACAPPI